jgi:hypothetical protein
MSKKTASFSLLVFFLFWPDVTCATAVEIHLHRDGAIVTETRKLRVTAGDDGRHLVSFPLPAAIIPSSLSVRLLGTLRSSIARVEINPALARRETEIQGLQKRIRAREEEKLNLQTRITAQEGKFLFWQSQTKQRAKNPGEAQLWAQNISHGLKKAREEKIKAEQSLHFAAEELKKLREELRRLAASAEHPWQVTVFISGSPPPREVEVLWSYLLTRSGWEPYYRLNALPQEKRLAVTRMAVLKKDPLLNWKEARLFIIDGYLPGIIESPLPHPWVIPLKAPGQQGKADLKGSAKTQILPQDKRSPPLLSLHTRPQPPGGITGLRENTMLLVLGEETWSAEFFHLIRPHQLTGAWLMAASIDDGPGGGKPPGEASFFLEGTFLGKGFWHPEDSPGGLILGQDHHVKSTYFGERKREEQVSGPAGPLTGHNLTWQTEVTNFRPYPVTLQVQKPLPQLTDPRVQIRFLYDPVPAQSNRETALWQQTLPPGGVARFQASLLLTMPANMELPDLLRP